MRRSLILTILVGSMLAPICHHAQVQEDALVAEANRQYDRCIELLNTVRYDEAEEVCQRSLTAAEKAFGSEHPNTATCLNNLAGLYRARGELDKAEPFYQRARWIYEKALGSEHPYVANPLMNLATLYYMKGEYVKAEPLAERALAIMEKAFGSEHPDVATTVSNLALIYQAKGESTKAVALYQRAMTIYEKAFGPEHPYVATALNNLALLYRDKGEFARAEPLYLRALAIREKAFGLEHLEVASSLNGLAGVYLMIGEHAKAEPLLERALAIREKVFGSEHPDVATSLNNLAQLYIKKGDYAKAEPLLRRALVITEKAFGSEHHFIASSLGNLAVLSAAKADYASAAEFLVRAQEIREGYINAVLATSSEKQKQLYLNTLAGETYLSVSLSAYSAPSNARAAQLALTTILRRKGRALDAMTDQIAGLRRRAAPDDVRLLNELAAAQSQLANLHLSNVTGSSAAQRRTRVTELETRIEKLQGDIGRRNAEFRANTQPVTLDAVRQAIPTDAALVEIFAYYAVNPKAKSINEYFGKGRYVAYVLKPQSDAPQFVELGEAAQLDAEVKLWREALLDPRRTDVRALGRRLDERLMRPVRKLLGDTKRIFISPDGALNLIPFAALVDENNKYLVETYSLNYLTGGHDLLRLRVRSGFRSGAFIFANPTYNLTNQPVAACQRRRAQRGLSLETADADAADDMDAATRRDIEYRGIDFTQVCYPPLRGTAEEAALITRALTNATVLMDRQATEAALKALNAPSILHVATHGFFLPDQPRDLNKETDVGASTVTNSENPLLRSGLIMAGANQKSSGAGEDGVLTAAEAAGLNLWGTKLVVLSACETGLGDVVNGAGVYGLRRALVLAGSQTQVMSLWQVSDAATRDLMTDYYRRLQRGEGRTEAMRQAQLAMLRGLNQPAVARARRAHPYYWAAFISSGDWRSMNGKEQ